MDSNNIIFGSCICDKDDIFLFDTSVTEITDDIQCGAAGFFTVSVRSKKNGSAHFFTSASDSSWVTASTSSNFEQVIINVSENTGSAERDANVTLTQMDSGKAITIKIHQGYANSAGCKYLVSKDWNFKMESQVATACETFDTYTGMTVYERCVSNYSNGEVEDSGYAPTTNYTVSYSPEFTKNTSSTPRTINVITRMVRQTGDTASDVKEYVNSGDSWTIIQEQRVMGDWANYSETPVMLDVTKTSPEGIIPQSGGNATFTATYSYNIVQRRYNSCDSSDYDEQVITGMTRDVTNVAVWSANTSYNGNVITVGPNESTSVVTYTMNCSYNGLSDSATVRQQKMAEITATTYDAKITALSSSIKACESLSYKVEERPTYYYDDGTNEVGSYSVANPSYYAVVVKNGSTVVNESSVSQYTGSSQRTLTLSLGNTSANRYTSFGSPATVLQDARVTTAGTATTSRVNESVSITQTQSVIGNGGGSSEYTMKYTSTVRTSTPYYDACGNYVNTVTSDAAPTTVDVTSSSTFAITSNPNNAGTISENRLTVASNDSTSSRTFTVSGSYNGLSSSISTTQEGSVKVTATTYTVSVSASDIKACESASYSVTERAISHWSDGTTTTGSSYAASSSDYSLSVSNGGTSVSLSDIPNYKGSVNRTLTITVTGSKYTNTATTSFVQSAYTTTQGSGTYFDNYNTWNASLSSSSVTCNGGTLNVTVRESWTSGYTYPVYNPCGTQVDTTQGSVGTHYVDVTSSASYSITSGTGYASVNSSGVVTISPNDTDYDISIVVSVTYKGSTETKTITLNACECGYSCEVSAVTSSSTIEACESAPSITVYTRSITSCTDGSTAGTWSQTSNYRTNWYPSDIQGYTGTTSRTVRCTVTVEGCGNYTVGVTQRPPSETTGSSSTYSTLSGITLSSNVSSVNCRGGSVKLSLRETRTTGTSASVKDACGNVIRTEYSNTGTTYQSAPLSAYIRTFVIRPATDVDVSLDDSTDILTIGSLPDSATSAISIEVIAEYGNVSDSVTITQNPCTITSTTYELRIYEIPHIDVCETPQPSVEERAVYRWDTGDVTYSDWTSANYQDYNETCYIGGVQVSESDILGYKGSTPRDITVVVSGSKYSNSPVSGTCTQSSYYETTDVRTTTTLNNFWIYPSVESVECAGGVVTFTAKAEYKHLEETKVYDPCGSLVSSNSAYTYTTGSVDPSYYDIVKGENYGTINGSTLTVNPYSGSNTEYITVRGTYMEDGIVKTDDAIISLRSCPTEYTITSNPSSLTCSGGTIQFTATPNS